MRTKIKRWLIRIKLKLNDFMVYLNFFCSTQYKYWDHVPNQSNRQSQRLHKDVHNCLKETYKWHYDVDRFQTCKWIGINISTVEQKWLTSVFFPIFLYDLYMLISVSFIFFFRRIIEQLHLESKICRETTFNYRKHSFDIRFCCILFQEILIM